MADGHVDNVHAPQSALATVKHHEAAAALDKQDLMQARVTVHGELPVVQHPTRRDSFSVHDIR
jgi:hypothetical protein